MLGDNLKNKNSKGKPLLKSNDSWNRVNQEIIPEAPEDEDFPDNDSSDYN